tara:strand:+ start:142 stop:360 length:219 start_codon:yes stop_codon:yes gene_type:complete
MDFYSRKAKAIKLIDHMLDVHTEEINEDLIDEIEYVVSKKYAIGRPTIMKRIKLYKRLVAARIPENLKKNAN